jgi:hypothetical protein
VQCRRQAGQGNKCSRAPNKLKHVLGVRQMERRHFVCLAIAQQRLLDGRSHAASRAPERGDEANNDGRGCNAQAIHSCVTCEEW